MLSSYAQAKFSLVELRRVRQRSWEDLDTYMKRFYNKALDYCDLVEERILVDVCLHYMLEECRIFFENLFFSSFSKLMEPARRTNDSVHRASLSSTSRSNLNSTQRKRSTIVTLSKDEGPDHLIQRSWPMVEEGQRSPYAPTLPL